MTALPLLSLAVAAAAAQCPYQLAYSVDWEIDESAWSGLCERAGDDAAKALEAGKAAFWRRCVERLGAAVPKGRATTAEIAQACRHGASTAGSFAAARAISSINEASERAEPPAEAYARSVQPSAPAVLEPPFDRLVALLREHAEPEDLSIVWEALEARPALKLEPAGGSPRERGRFEAPRGAPIVTLYARPAGAPPGEPELAGTLLHELHHLVRWKRGGGANVYTMERDARDAQLRFLARYAAAGAAPALEAPRLALLEAWRKTPRLARGEVSECYGGRLGVDGTIEGERAATSDPRRLAALAADEREARAAEAFDAAWRKRMGWSD